MEDLLGHHLREKWRRLRATDNVTMSLRKYTCKSKEYFAQWFDMCFTIESGQCLCARY